MSQERRRLSPSRAKSPSRIPISSTLSSHRKRTAAVLPESVGKTQCPTPVQGTPKALTGFRRLEALAKADVKARSVPTNASEISSSPWVEKHLPQSLDDLFVHKKKVDDVISWLTRVFGLATVKRNNVCVFSGPAGCGKTATIFLAAKHLQADVKEWANPMSLTDKTFNPFDFEGRRDEVQGRTELDLFKDFLEINSHYRTLPINGRKMKSNRVIVVEDFPNGLYRDLNSFHGILRNYSANGKFPLVFIITDTVNSDHSMYKMFPKLLMNELNIQNISFNPVASSLMTKFLLDICGKESKPIDKSQVEEIAATANGDIRCAVNNLQFFLTKERGWSSGLSGGFRKPPPKRSRINKKNSISSPKTAMQQKDDTIQLFKALGKVLYAKRDETMVSDVEMLLGGDMEAERRLHPLLEDPENIVTKLEVTADTFLGFLHQNYPSFYGSMDQLRVASEYLSTADFILSGWKFDDSGTKTFKARDTKEQISMNVAVRGLMHSNSNRISTGWKPLTKPLVSNLANYTRESVESTRQALYHLRELQTTLFTETIPLYAKLLQVKPSSTIDGRKEILEKGLFKHMIKRAESLDEKETVDDSSNSENTEDSEDTGVLTEKEIVATKNLATQDMEVEFGSDEEFVIEEFCD